MALEVQPEVLIVNPKYQQQAVQVLKHVANPCLVVLGHGIDRYSIRDQYL